MHHSTIYLMDPGTAAITPLAGANDTAGFQNGTGAAALFNRPYGVSLMPNGDIVMADQNNNRIRRITQAGVVTTYAGDGTPAYRDGPRQQARFDGPQDVAADAAGNVYVTDCNNQLIRRISAAGVVTTVAGVFNVAGFRNGNGPQALFYGQEGIALSANGKVVYVADGTKGEDDPTIPPYHRVRKIVLP
jgi:sugar lactone lactonase YvrE